MNKGLEEELLNSGKRHWINFKDPSGETEREMFFCVEDYLMQKKALEIIKEKQVNYRTLLCIFNTSDNYKDYNKLYPRNKLTQKEYNLLRKVLS